MYTLIIIFAFIGMYASGILSCIVIVLALDTYKQNKKLRKNSLSSRGEIYGRTDYRTQYRP